jgi:hypothetical protein
VSEELDFGRLVCQSIGLNPEIVRSIVIEVFPESGLTITLEIPPDSEIAREELKHPKRVILMEIDEWQID